MGFSPPTSRSKGGGFFLSPPLSEAKGGESIFVPPHNPKPRGGTENRTPLRWGGNQGGFVDLLGGGIEIFTPLAKIGRGGNRNLTPLLRGGNRFLHPPVSSARGGNRFFYPPVFIG